MSKTKSVEVPLEAGVRRISAELSLSCEGLPDTACRLQLPASVWLVPAAADTETFAELLLGGSLAFMQSKLVTAAAPPDDFHAVIGRMVARVGVARVCRPLEEESSP